MKGRLTTFVMATMAIAIVFMAAPIVRAYSVSPPPMSSTPASQLPPQNLFLPFQNFVNSINSVGPSVVRLGGSISPPTPPNALRAGAQNALDRLDAWLYGSLGFHVSAIFLAILSVFSWILGAVKGVVDWVLGLFH